MAIHSHARAVISKLTIPSPIVKYFSNVEWDIDLSNNTNPHFHEFSSYPDIKQNEIKSLYLSQILYLNVYSEVQRKTLSEITTENILFTVGSMEGIDILLRTFCEPNKDKICIVVPTFSAYEHWGIIHNIDVVKVPLYGENLNEFDLDAIIKINPKMVFICNPNNPVGTIINIRILEKLCENFEGLIVVDEAYIEFSDQISFLLYLNRYKNLVILRTLSKAWGLAGVRCGIIIADKLLIHTLRYVQLPFGFSSPTQAVIKQALLSPKDIFSSWKRIKHNRQVLITALCQLPIVSKIFNSETNFIFIILKNSQHVLNLLKENKIQVFDCSLSIPHSIRVSLGTEEQNKKFIEVMHKASAF